MGEIEFKGELHTIPAGAALVLAVDRHLTQEQAEQIKRHVREALPGREVLVVGPGVTVSALERLPVVSMGLDMASGPDMAAAAEVYADAKGELQINIVNRSSESIDPKALFDAITTWSASSAEITAAAAVEAAVRDPNSRVSRALSENFAKGGEISNARIDRALAMRREESAAAGEFTSVGGVRVAGPESKGEDPMAAVRAMSKGQGR